MMHTLRYGVGILLMLVIFWAGSGHADTSVKLWLINYETGGSDFNDASCDPFWGACDPYFRFCGNTGTNASRECSMFDFMTCHYDNTNSVKFGSTFCDGEANPINFNITTPYEGFELKVYAQDKDDSVFDHVDDLIDYVLFTYNATPAANSSTVEWQNFTAYGERLSGAASYLELRVQVYCSDDYYGSNCSVYCVPQWDHDCDHQSGEPIYNTTTASIALTTPIATTTTQLPITTESNASTTPIATTTTELPITTESNASTTPIATTTTELPIATTSNALTTPITMITTTTTELPITTTRHRVTDEPRNVTDSSSVNKQSLHVTLQAVLMVFVIMHVFILC